jgi:hypothetical protein
MYLHLAVQVVEVAIVVPVIVDPVIVEAQTFLLNLQK